jgi:FkbM family methyltransferase
VPAAPHAVPCARMRLGDAFAKGVKLGRLLAVGEYRRMLVRTRVAAAVEHDRVRFARGYRSIIDVGANRGQFAIFARHRFPTAQLWCFEPGRDAFAKLVEVIGDHAHCVNCALGEAEGSAELHVARADDSSSLLVPTALQTDTYAEASITCAVTVEVKALDDFVDAIDAPFLLKMDVQGYELEVLRGGRRLLDGDGDLLIECSFRELYAAQPLADEIIAFVRPFGYRLRGVSSVSRGADGTPLQGDFFFSR